MHFRTYVLNLDRHPERLSPLKSALDEQGVSWQRFSAFDGTGMPQSDLDELVASSGPIPRVTVGARACTASHIGILREFLETGETHALILEDDAELSGDLFQDLPGIIEASPSGILNINRQPSSSEIKRLVVDANAHSVAGGYEVHNLESIHYGTAGYVIDRDAAQMILELYPRPDIPIDHMLFNPNVSRLFGKMAIKQLFPALVRPREDTETTIQKTKVPSTNSLKNRWKRTMAEISIVPRLLWKVLIGRSKLKILEFKG